jgi:hypothetical protein
MMCSALSLATAPTHALGVLVVDYADMIRDIVAAFVASTGHEGSRAMTAFDFEPSPAQAQSGK